MKKLILFLEQLFCKHYWAFTSINYLDEHGHKCVDMVCRKCGKKKTYKE